MESGRRILVSRPHFKKVSAITTKHRQRSYVGMACHRALVERYFPAIPSAIPAAMGNLKSSCRYALIMDSDCSSIRASLRPEPIRCDEETGIAPAVVHFEWNRIGVGLPRRTSDETRWRYEGRVMLEPSPSSHLSGKATNRELSSCRVTIF